jgi:hypothetical protein
LLEDLGEAAVFEDSLEEKGEPAGVEGDDEARKLFVVEFAAGGEPPKPPKPLK